MLKSPQSAEQLARCADIEKTYVAGKFRILHKMSIINCIIEDETKGASKIVHQKLTELLRLGQKDVLTRRVVIIDCNGMLDRNMDK